MRDMSCMPEDLIKGGLVGSRIMGSRLEGIADTPQGTASILVNFTLEECHIPLTAISTLCLLSPFRSHAKSTAAMTYGFREPEALCPSNPTAAAREQPADFGNFHFTRISNASSKYTELCSRQHPEEIFF